MRLKHFHIYALAMAILLPMATLVADDSETASAAPTAVTVTDLEDIPVYSVYESLAEFTGEDSTNPYLEFEDVPYESMVAVRSGLWGVMTNGSKTKVGEYQWLDSSAPFIDVDGLFTNGVRTLDIYATGLERDVAQTGVYYYGPRLSFSGEYDRYVHRLDHRPLDPSTGWQGGLLSSLAAPYPAPGALNPGNITQFAQDLNVGQDYAIRVQELKANFKGELTENLRWRLNVFGLEKSGDRQARGMAHCYNLAPASPPAPPNPQVLTPGITQRFPQTTGNRCHLLAQTQQIDWVTLELEPVIEARLTDWLTIEYSHTIRTFQQNDGPVFRPFNGSGLPTGAPANGPINYAFVPDFQTDIDRLKAFVQLGPNTDLYTLGYIGDQQNKFRDINRHLGGADARITNRSFDGLQLVGYGKYYFQRSPRPARLAVGPFFDQVPTPTNPDPLPHDLVDREFTALGGTTRWMPFQDECDTLRSRTAVISGYEYSQINRHDAAYELLVMRAGATPPIDATKLRVDEFFQPNSYTNKVFVGLQQDLTCALRTNIKYTYINTQYPLFGVTAGQRSGGPDDFAPPAVNVVNSALPTRVQRVELGANWQPVDNFLLSGTVYLEDTYHESPYARFNQDSYPWMVSAWYAPTCKWSFSAGFAQLTSWIDQDITLGSQARYGTQPPHINEWEATPSFTAPWQYRGRADVLTLGTNYALTQCFQLTGGFEYVHGVNSYATPPSAPTGPFLGAATAPNVEVNSDGTAVVQGNTGGPINYSDLPGYSKVDVDTYRFTAGFDYLLRQNISTFFRYNYFDYTEFAYNTGEAHMFLGGITGTY